LVSVAGIPLTEDLATQSSTKEKISVAFPKTALIVEDAIVVDVSIEEGEEDAVFDDVYKQAT